MPPLLVAILNDERLFGDGPPTWKKAPPAHSAWIERKRVIKRLRYFRNRLPGALRLADILDGCARSKRCMSHACPECQRAIKRWFVGEADTLIKMTQPAKLYAASIIVPGGRTNIGALDSTPMSRVVQQVRTVLRASGLFRWGVCAVDISMNDDKAKQLGQAWQLQVYGVLASDDAATTGREISTALRRLIPDDPAVMRPVKVKACDGSAYATSYVLKTQFSLRVAYAYMSRDVLVWNTRKVSVKARHHAELLLYLHKSGVADRFLFHRVKPAKSRGRVHLKHA